MPHVIVAVHLKYRSGTSGGQPGTINDGCMVELVTENDNVRPFLLLLLLKLLL
jgi:hypothetical protein